VALPSDGENVMDRGIRLEEEALKRFEKEISRKVDSSLVLWISEDDENIAVSPDGMIGKTEAVEIKCLNSATHIEAWLTQKIPKEHYFQIIQYFIVNLKLKTLYFVFYDPRIPAKDFFYFTIKRKEVEADVKKYKALQLEAIKEIEKITLELTNF